MSKLTEIAEKIGTAVTGHHSLAIQTIKNYAADHAAVRTAKSDEIFQALVTANEFEQAEQAERASALAELDDIKQAKLVQLQSEDIDDNVMKSVLEVQAASDVYLAQYGANLTTLSEEHEQLKDDYVNERGDFKDAKAAFDGISGQGVKSGGPEGNDPLEQMATAGQG